MEMAHSNQCYLYFQFTYFEAMTAIALKFFGELFLFESFGAVVYYFLSSVTEELLLCRRRAVVSEAGVCPPKW